LLFNHEKLTLHYSFFLITLLHQIRMRVTEDLIGD